MTPILSAAPAALPAAPEASLGATIETPIAATLETPIVATLPAQAGATLETPIPATLPAPIAATLKAQAGATLEPPPEAPPTLADVARLAGVSSATASRVLTGSPHVQQDTRLKVERAMAQLGYVRNRAARGSRPPQAGSIALVVGEDNSKIFADPFFAQFLLRIGTAAAAADLLLIQLTLTSNRDRNTVTRYLRDGHVDGALFVSMHARPDLDLKALGLPVVVCGRPIGAADNLSYVDADNVGGARTAVEHLLGSGRKAVATIAGPPDMCAGVDRLLGYRQVISEAGLADPGMVAYGDFSRRAGEHALYRLIDLRPKLDAVFAASDLMAAGALSALRRLGRRVPDDVAVIGFDDSPVAHLTDPKLSTVRQPVDVMTARAIRELMALTVTPGQRPVHVVLPTQLIIRDSG